MNEVIEASNNVPAQMPHMGRGLSAHVNAGIVAIESDRAVAEAQGKLLIAQRFPRNTSYALEELLRACQEPALAEEAFYSYNRGSETVTGPSIRLAEEMARCWGNTDYGIRELSQKEGVSEMEAYCWDMQTNTVSKQTFTVRHVRDTKQGGKALTGQRDIYELTANMGGRRLRARILACMPKWLVATAIEECKKTLTKGGKSTAERARKMVSMFLAYGVTTAMIEAKIGKKIEQITGDDLTTLLGTYNALKDGQVSAAEAFDGEEKTSATAAAITAMVDTDRTKAATPKVENPKPEPLPQAANEDTPGEPAPKAETPASPRQAAKPTTTKPAPKPAPSPQPEPEATPDDEAVF